MFFHKDYTQAVIKDDCFTGKRREHCPGIYACLKEQENNAGPEQVFPWKIHIVSPARPDISQSDLYPYTACMMAIIQKHLAIVNTEWALPLSHFLR
jgi:hypothetical protein